MIEPGSVAPEAVLFDLDGTLLDTAGDLIAAVNTLLVEDGRSPVPPERLRPWVSQGGLTLVSLAYDLPRESEQAHGLWKRYLVAYESAISNHSRIFRGLEGVLDALEKSGRPWGIVTNKPGYLSQRLLQELDMLDRPACLICGDTASRSKPWPDPVLLACDRIGIAPGRTLMVGDDCRDIDSARAAGARAVAAAWGYIRPDDSPDSWGADGVVNRPAMLAPWIGSA
jgi:phosphoglycolate phosphatase